jgi:predicted  nucleic acid-binding Zn-ribbon protein
MKQILSKEDVKRAIELLASQGKKPTLVLLHAALNHRGSMSTLCRLKSELEAAAQLTSDSEEGLKTFRELWALAFNEGRVSHEATIAELRENLKAVSVENERLEGHATAAQDHADQVVSDKSRLESKIIEDRARAESELSAVRTCLVSASAQAADALQKLAQAQAAHASQMLNLQTELKSVAQKSHDLELELVRCRTLAKAKGIHISAATAEVLDQN